jgi:hypothetical protein
VAGETAESPGGVLEPVLVLCASASEFVKTSADTTAINAFFITVFLIPLPPVAGFAGNGRCVSGQVGITP